MDALTKFLALKDPLGKRREFQVTEVELRELLAEYDEELAVTHVGLPYA